MKIKKTETIILLGLILAIILSTFGALAVSVSELEESIFRLHILANSDSTQDQNLKLAVRDAVLEYSNEIYRSLDNKEEAISITKEEIDNIKKIADKVIKENGYDYETKVYVTNMYFEPRQYENITLPAGNYDALRIEIGEAKGHNWWCVMFPSICISGSAKLTSNVNTQTADVVQNRPKYEMRFFIVDWFKKIFW